MSKKECKKSAYYALLGEFTGICLLFGGIWREFADFAMESFGKASVIRTNALTADGIYLLITLSAPVIIGRALRAKINTIASACTTYSYGSSSTRNALCTPIRSVFRMTFSVC